MFSSTRSSRSSNTLTSFYDGSGTDPRGRKLSDILKWDANQLEASHDYIQILFPLPEESGVNWNAPIINKEVFDAFRGSVELKDAMRGAFSRMAWFYGFKVERKEGGEVEVSILPFLLLPFTFLARSTLMAPADYKRNKFLRARRELEYPLRPQPSQNHPHHSIS